MADELIVAHGSAPETKRPSRWLSQRIIKTHFQLKFSFMIFFFLSVAMALIWLEGHFAVKHMVATGMVSGGDAIAQLELLNSLIGKTSILALAITFGLALFFSHYIAGPIYRFEKTLEAMKDGDLTIHVRLRKKDELQEVADLFNQALASLRVKLKNERDSVEKSMVKAAALSANLSRAGRTAEAKELDQLCNDIRNTPPQIHI